MKRHLISAKKPTHLHWTPEQHRRYIETLGPHLPAIFKSLGFLVLAIGAAVGIIFNNTDASAWAAKLLPWLFVIHSTYSPRRKFTLGTADAALLTLCAD